MVGGGAVPAAVDVVRLVEVVVSRGAVAAVGAVGSPAVDPVEVVGEASAVGVGEDEEMMEKTCSILSGKGLLGVQREGSAFSYYLLRQLLTGMFQI